MKQVIRKKYNYGLGHIESEFYVARRTASWKCQLEIVLNYKCIFGNHLHGSDSWNPGSESIQSVERENYLEQYLEEYMLVSVEEGETAKEKATVVRGVE